jgi:hypothetical protein
VPFRKQKNGEGLITSVMTAYLVLILHISLLVIMGFLVLLFRGLVNYMVWILIGGGGLVAFSAWWFFRRLKDEGRNLREAVNAQRFKDQTVEVSLLGGLASFRVGAAQGGHLLDGGDAEAPPQLEAPDTVRVRELTELAKLLQKGLITRDEYEKAKHQIFKN